MPKYWVKNYFTHGRFPEVGQKQKTEKKKREREKEREKERKYVITMAKLRMAHASTHGARKPPGPQCKHYNKRKMIKQNYLEVSDINLFLITFLGETFPWAWILIIFAKILLNLSSLAV